MKKLSGLQALNIPYVYPNPIQSLCEKSIAQTWLSETIPVSDLFKNTQFSEKNTDLSDALMKNGPYLTS